MNKLIRMHPGDHLHYLLHDINPKYMQNWLLQKSGIHYTNASWTMNHCLRAVPSERQFKGEFWSKMTLVPIK